MQAKAGNARCNHLAVVSARCQNRTAATPLQLARMQSTMTMRAQAPVAVSARPVRSSRSAPRMMSISTQMGQMARVSGTPLQTLTAARMITGMRRRQMLLVEAAKKSVGDLQKADLEGKRVLVRPTTCCSPLCNHECFNLFCSCQLASLTLHQDTAF